MFASADSPLSRVRALCARRSITPSSSRRRTACAGAAHDGEAGIALLEVIVASALVAIIAIGTLTGLEGATATTNDNRLHNQAAVLASQSQETLRSDPAETLKTLAEKTESKESRTETVTIENQKFTIEESVHEINGATGASGCTSSSKEGESSHAGGYYFKTSSIVTWPQLGTKREAVKQTSVITPPDGSSLEVTVDTAASTPEPVQGATVDAGGSITTTDSSGCVIYPTINATTVSLSVEKTGYVTEGGEPKFSTESIEIAPDITTQYQVILSPAGEIEAIFTYKAGTEYKGEKVTGDTFVATNTGLSSGFAIGGAVNTYAGTATTSDSLSPFPEKWSVYAGDCTSDNPVKDKLEDGAVQVVGGKRVSVKVPMSYVTLNVHTGSSKSKEGSASTTSYPVTITDPLCAEAIPFNGTTAQYEHQQTTTTSGHLTYPFQPYGKFALCLYNATAQKTYTVPYENTTEAGSTVNIYLEASSSGEKVEIKTSQKTNTC